MEETRQDTVRDAGSDAPLAPGTVVGEYVIESLLGRGGFGSVYRASQPVIGKQVAVKVLALRYSVDEAIVSRFVAEARAVNQIRHPNIIDIFAFGQLPDGRHYYVMELLDGEPLDRFAGTLTLAEALPILRALARALDAAHGKGIAHRDLKPENVFVARDADGTRYPKLLDFGIAKLLAPDDQVAHHTATGVALGTPYYMSPEQCRGRDVDCRTDIYSFGVLAYRVLTGAYPFTGDFMELMTAQISREAPPASSHRAELPPSVDDAIAWMMRKDPAARPPTLGAAVDALDPAAVARTSRPSLAAPLARPRRHLGIYAAIAAAVVAAAVIVVWESRKPDATPVPAQPVAAPTPPGAAPTQPVAASAPTPPVAPPPQPVAPPAQPVAPATPPVAAPAVAAPQRRHVAKKPAVHEAPDSLDVIHLPHDSFAR